MWNKTARAFATRFPKMLPVLERKSDFYNLKKNSTTPAAKQHLKPALPFISLLADEIWVMSSNLTFNYFQTHVHLFWEQSDTRK